MLGGWAWPDQVLEAEHALLWTQHGGSGYSYTRADFLDMTIRQIEDRIDRARQARKAEHKALKKAQESAKRRSR